MENIDWNSCIICNKCDGELNCPVDSHLNNGFEICRSLGALPVNVNFEGDNFAELFYQKKVSGINYVT